MTGNPDDSPPPARNATSDEATATSYAANGAAAGHRSGTGDDPSHGHGGTDDDPSHGHGDTGNDPAGARLLFRYLGR